MVVCNECIKDVLSRIYLEGIARNGMPPQIYWEAKQALDRLDKTCLTVYSNSDPNCPVGWRINNYPILTVGKKNSRLKFSYTKECIDNEILVIVEEVADTYGNILTEDIYNKEIKTNTMNTNKNVIRLTESNLRGIIAESVKQVLSELDWKTYMNTGKKRLQQRHSDKRENGFDSLEQADKAFNDKYGSNVTYDKHGSRNSFDKQDLTRTYGKTEGQYDRQDIRMQVKNDLYNPHFRTLGKYTTLTYDPKSKWASSDGMWSNNTDPKHYEDFHFSYADEAPILKYMAQADYERAKKEADAYENGDYEYDPNGRGWHLKNNVDESICRAIRKVLRLKQ